MRKAKFPEENVAVETFENSRDTETLESSEYKR